MLTVLGVSAAAPASRASASTTMIPHPGVGAATGVAPSQEPAVRTVVVGGTPGWQIVLIAVVAALVAAVAAVIADRARAARRRPLGQPA